MKKFFILPAALILVVSAAMLLVNRKAEVAGLPVPQKRSFSVETVVPSQREIVSAYPLLAHINSKKLTRIATRYSSVITEIPVHESQHVRRGELLIRLDEGDVQRMIRSLESKKAALERELAVLTKRFHSDTTLFKAGAISEERFDSSRLLLESKSAALVELDTDLQTRKQQLPYYEIRAPYDGIVGAIAVETGDLSVPGKGMIELHSEDKIARVTYPSTLPVSRNAAVYSQGVRIGSIALRYADAPQGLYEAEIALEPGTAFVNGEAVPVTVELHKVTHCSVPEKALFSSRGSYAVMEYRDGVFAPLAVDVVARDGSYAAIDPCPENSVAAASAAKLAALALQDSIAAAERP